MSSNFKTYPKPILRIQSSQYDQNRKDRFGKTMKDSEQHISFKDNILDESLESIYYFHQSKIDFKHRKKKNSKKRKKKSCHCTIQ